MKYGVSFLSIIPCRKDPAEASEMITQVLFGDHYKVIIENLKWIKIRLQYDGYEGWIDKKQWIEINQKLYNRISESRSKYYVSDIAGIVNHNNEQFPIVLGSALPLLNEGEMKAFKNNNLSFLGEVRKRYKRVAKKQLIEDALLYMNAPYLWGGKTPFGIDCSGFSQMVYKLNGVELPRDAYQQAEIGTTLSFVEESEEGDLAFFDNEEGRIIHVGIVLADNHIIHASGKVRIDKLDHQGIYNVESNSYSHRLRLIKKII